MPQASCKLSTLLPLLVTVGIAGMLDHLAHPITDPILFFSFVFKDSCDYMDLLNLRTLILNHIYKEMVSVKDNIFTGSDG